MSGCLADCLSAFLSVFVCGARWDLDLVCLFLCVVSVLCEGVRGCVRAVVLSSSLPPDDVLALFLHVPHSFRPSAVADDLVRRIGACITLAWGQLSAAVWMK